ncbi:glutathione S-transferase N-terminal domain-containing protein [Hydrogenophaga atypica]|uniref:Glutathione S-transferase N-terminal domain-containing protein n=1 Tax=Hydrogenophaga atypica TaxID=249409 RepID=A0ABW2QHC3_9BURK
MQATAEASAAAAPMVTAAPNDRYRLLGGPGSPYSLKMRALLRYRRLPHLWIVPRGYIGAGGELAEASKGIIPVLQYPDGAYRADTTPLIYDLERRHPGVRSVVPEDRAVALLSHLIEDMGDELLVSAMFDLRWGDEANQRFCATRQMYGWLGPAEPADFSAIIERFTRRQTKQRAQVAAGDNHAGLMAFYEALLDAMEALVQHMPYVFGDRPALADFGLYGQLSQCAIDPSASAIFRERAPRTYQWTQSLDDACGVEGDWAPRSIWEPHVRPLLALVGQYHLPLLQTSHDAVEQGVQQMERLIEGHCWLVHGQRYKHKCLVWLQREWQGLTLAEQDSVRGLLTETGCMPFLADGPTAQLPVPEMAPL